MSYILPLITLSTDQGTTIQRKNAERNQWYRMWDILVVDDLKPQSIITLEE